MVFGLLNTPKVQEYARERIVDELQTKLQTKLGIKKISFQPFSAVQVDSIYLYDQSKQQTLLAQKLYAKLDIFALLKGKMVVTAVELSDFDIHLRKETPKSPLNIQYIIDAFKPQDKERKDPINVKLSTIDITNGRFTYDVEDKVYKAVGFDANHINVSDLNAKFSVKSILPDSLNIQAKKLTLKEKSGLKISNLVTRLITKDKKFALKGFRLDLPSSYLELDKAEVDMSSMPDTEYVNTLDYAKFDLIISPSYISPKDVSAFTSTLQYFNDLVSLRGRISGDIDSITAENLTVNFKNRMNLTANAFIKDIRDKEKTYIKGSVNRLTISSDGIEGIADNFSRNKNQLPKEVYSLGQVSFHGDIFGYLDKLTASGTLATEIGTIKTDVKFGFNPSAGLKSFLEGHLETDSFQLGTLTGNNNLGNIDLDIFVNMKRSAKNQVSGNLKGIVNQFEFKNYSYEDINFDVNYDGKKIDGGININSSDGLLDIKGLVDFSNPKEPKIDVHLDARNVELDDLQLAKNFSNSNISLMMHAKLRGNSIDNLVGHVTIDAFDMIRNDQYMHLQHFYIESTKDSLNNSRIKIESDLLNGEITGQYALSKLANSFKQTAHSYLPAVINIQEKDLNRKDDNALKFNFKVENTELLSSMVGLPFSIIEPTELKGRYDNINNQIELELKAPFVKFGGTQVKNIYLSTYNKGEILNAEVRASLLGKKNIITDIKLNAKSSDNKVLADIELENNSPKLTKGKFSLETLFSKESNKEPLQIDIDVLPSELLMNKATWVLPASHILVKGGVVQVNQFSIHTKDFAQAINIDGEFSKLNENSVLQTDLKNVDLEYVFETLAIDALKFGGYASGSLFLSSIEQKPYAVTNLNVTDFKFNYAELGTLNLFSELDKETNMVVLDGKIKSPENKTTTVKGTIDPIKQGLSLNFDADSINIGFLGLYAQSIFDHVSGHGTGKVHLFGNFSKVTVEGDAFIENGNMGISFLNTNYSFTDSVHMKKDLIYFNNIKLIDKNENIALASGKLTHDYFSNFVYFIDLTAEDFLLYDTNPKVNPHFFGKVYGSGKGSISGDEQDLSIDISMRTNKDTKVHMNFMDNVVNEYSFIDYVESPTAKKNKETEDNNPRLGAIEPPKPGMGINMNFYIDATPDAEVEILMDPVGGDMIKGNGSGTIQFQWNTKDAPRIYGTYNINRGSYNFTFQRLLERKFLIEDGSRVQFKGDPFEAVLDIDAIYKVTANLNDLDRDIVKSSGQSTIPVNCILNLTGPLRQPLVKMDLAFPTTDAEVERQIKSLINTEDMISRQVTYLLLLSKFYTPSYAVTEHRTSDFAAVASATLSNQLTKIVSQIDKRWQLGTNIRTSDAEFTSTEVELILSSQLLNNRLLINGNFGYRDDPSIRTDNGRAAFINDIDVELLLNTAGTWRIKAYNHYNEKYYYYKDKGSTQTQGLAIIYKRSFDKIQELYFWRRDKKKKKKRLVPNKEAIKEEKKDYSFIDIVK